MRRLFMLSLGEMTRKTKAMKKRKTEKGRVNILHLLLVVFQEQGTPFKGTIKRNIFEFMAVNKNEGEL